MVSIQYVRLYLVIRHWNILEVHVQYNIIYGSVLFSGTGYLVSRIINSWFIFAFQVCFFSNFLTEGPRKIRKEREIVKACEGVFDSGR